MNAGWDEALLAEELKGLIDDDFDIKLTGFSDEEIEALMPEELPYQGDEEHVPEVPEIPVTKEGDIWLLGDHRVMCGDSTSIDAVEKLMDGQKAQLLHADPPYGMGKENDGVANDNLYNDKLDSFQMEWWTTFRTFIEDNGSAYIWGNAEDLWRLWYKGGLSDSERLTFRNEIIWNKESGQGMMSEQHRMFPTASERCLFFMLGEQGFNNNADNYWEGWEPIRLYLEGERKKAGWDVPAMKRAAGHSDLSRDHWTSKSQWSFITEEVYKKLQAAANDQAFQKEYQVFQKDYQVLKNEFYATRAHFDNTHDNMTDVWSFDRVSGEDRQGHATPKPVEMMERVMNSSLMKGGLCVEPFGGSGSTLIGAEKTGRKCYTMELQEKYCDVIVKRWQEYTGKEATLESTGETFNSLI
jgi:DNA modification methylase